MNKLLERISSEFYFYRIYCQNNFSYPKQNLSTFKCRDIKIRLEGNYCTRKKRAFEEVSNSLKELGITSKTTVDKERIFRIRFNGGEVVGYDNFLGSGDRYIVRYRLNGTDKNFDKKILKCLRSKKYILTNPSDFYDF